MFISFSLITQFSTSKVHLSLSLSLFFFGTSLFKEKIIKEAKPLLGNDLIETKMRWVDIQKQIYAHWNSYKNLILQYNPFNILSYWLVVADCSS